MLRTVSRNVSTPSQQERERGWKTHAYALAVRDLGAVFAFTERRATAAGVDRGGDVETFVATGVSSEDGLIDELEPRQATSEIGGERG